MKAPAAALLYALLAEAASAQQQPEKPLVFAAEAGLVAVDVSVVDGRGRPLPDLRPEDFTLEVDGKPRRISSVEFIRLGEETAAPVAPPGVTTNEGMARGRLVLLAIDQGSIRRGSIRDVTLAADGLLDRLSPADRLGLVAFPPPRPNLEFTAEHVKVREALAKVVGRAQLQTSRLGLIEALALDDDPFRWNQVVDRECAEAPSGASTRGSLGAASERERCIPILEEEARGLATEFRARSQTTLASLRAIFEALAKVEGPKTLVLISQGVYAQSPSELREVAALAAAARVTLFVLRLDRGSDDASVARPSASSAEDRQAFGTGLGDLARMARGAVFTVGGSAAGAFDRIASEISGYYLLGFEPEEADRDDRSHDIQIGVRRSGVTVRARRTLRIERASSGPKPEESVTAALRSPMPLPDVPLRAATYLSRPPSGDAVRVMVSAELPRADSAGAMVGFVLLDAKGAVAAGGMRRAEGDHVVLASDVPKGDYTLKLAAVDRAGRRGSLDHPVRVALSGSEGLELADLTLMQPGEGGAPRLATATKEGPLFASLEAYAREKASLQGVEVRFEVADEAEAPALLTSQGPLSAQAETPLLARAASSLGVGVLPPGDYLARAVVTRGGRELGRVGRGFRIPPPEPGAEKSGARRLNIAELRQFLPRFDRGEALRPEVLGYFLDRMEALAGPPSSKPAEQARAHARGGNLDAVFADLRSVDRDSLDVAFLRGLHFLAKGELPGAETQFKEALRHSSEFVAAAFFIGACRAARGEDRQAIGAWQTTLVTEPQAPAVRSLLADALLRADQPDEALSLLSALADAAPQPGAGGFRLGLAAALAGKREQALALLTAHVDQHPNDLGALYLSMRLLFDGFAAGDQESPFARDPARFSRYAKAYVAGGGPQPEIIERWLRYMRESRR